MYVYNLEKIVIFWCFSTFQQDSIFTLKTKSCKKVRVVPFFFPKTPITQYEIEYLNRYLIFFQALGKNILDGVSVTEFHLEIQHA